MHPRNKVFAALCQRPETRTLAECIYSIATQRTARGTGRDLGLGPDALSAICAFLASERQGRGEISEEQAQTRASLDPKRFRTALAAVEELVPTSSTATEPRNLVTFVSLVRQHAVREDAAVAMMEVEATLVQSGALSDARVDPGSAAVRCAIFHWVCTKILEVTNAPGLPLFQHEFKVPKNRWTMVQNLLGKHCSHMVARLADMAKTAATPRVTRSQTRTPTKVMRSTSLNHPMSSPVKPFDKESVVSMTKRKAPVGTGFHEEESPSKRPKGGSYKPSKLGQDVTTPTPKTKRGNAAAITTPGRKSMQYEDDEEVPTAVIVTRSARSLHTPLDNAIRNARRPTIAAISTKQPFTPSRDVTETPSLTSTPMTSTGMSDISSPDSPPHLRVSRVQVRSRVRSPSLAPPEGSPSSSEDEDEMPRRRRRNLRAPFLDRGAYSWKPSARTAQILERSRKWEASMIKKYGDPWDEL